MFIWIGKLGLNLFYTKGESFARYDPEEGGTMYGPYTLWFERRFIFIYWAITKPYKRSGISFGN